MRQERDSVGIENRRMDSDLIVRILNGPHEGAQMEIPREGITLGSDDDCDLIIFDAHIAPRHLRLLPQQEGHLILSPLEGEVFLDGVRIEEDTVLEGPSRVITAGETHLVAGAAHQEWPDITIPSEQPPIEDHLQASGNLIPPEDLPSPGKIGGKARSSFLRVLIGGGAIVFIGLGAYFAYEALSKKWKSSKEITPIIQHAQPLKKFTEFWRQILPKKSPQTTADSAKGTFFPLENPKKTPPVAWTPVPLEVQVAQELFQQVPGVVFSINEKEKRKQFTVWVRGETAATAARRILDRASPPLTYNLIELSQLETSAKTLAQLYGIALQVHIDPEGIAFWKGYLHDDKNWENFFPRIIRDLPAIRDNRCEIVFGTRLVPLLQAELNQQGFHGNVRAVAEENGLRFEGAVPKEQQAKWDAWLAIVREKYNSVASIADDVNSATIVRRSLKEFFPSQVLGISGSIMPWISLADGSKLFPGAKLKNGYTLEAITSDTLRINGPDGKMNFNLSTLN